MTPLVTDAATAPAPPARPPYEPPTLIRHQAGLMNKFAQARTARPLTHVDGVSLDTLVETYGSPLFVFSQKTLEARCVELKSAFDVRYPKVRLAWSYKTNYLGAICRVMHGRGAWAEVVSRFEYDKARALGVPGERIHFNGPLKTADDLRLAFSEGALVHLDNHDELALAEQVARQLGIRPAVALRVNFTTSGTPAWSRFGFNVESGEALLAARRLVAGDALRLVGLHTHLGTFVSDAESYREGAAVMARLANRLREELGVVIELLDMGGGFASHNTLKAQYLPGEQTSPPVSRYAEAIADGLAELSCDPGQLPTLVLETGRALVDDAGTLVGTVVANRRMPDGRRGVVLDVGVNVLFTSFWYKHELLPTRPLGGVPEPTVFFGPLCMNIDVVRETMLFPPVGPGERLAFRSVGAYNVTQWMQFITYRPAVVLIGPDGQHGVIRRREDLQTVTAPEQDAPWL